MTDANKKFGGIILCGGRSVRMGQPKLSLPFGSEVMLERVVRILSEVVSPVVVVAAKGQELPPLPAEVIIARDEHDDLGPLAGLAAGLSLLSSRVDAAYLSACDVPLLKPEFVRFMIGALQDRQLVIPREGKYHHPLAAVYRTDLLQPVRDLVAAGRLRPLFLVEDCDANVIDVEELRRVDPRLDSLQNINTPEEYEAALADAGFLTE